MVESTDNCPALGSFDSSEHQDITPKLGIIHQYLLWLASQSASLLARRKPEISPTTELRKAADSRFSAEKSRRLKIFCYKFCPVFLANI